MKKNIYLEKNYMIFIFLIVLMIVIGEGKLREMSQLHLLGNTVETNKLFRRHDIGEEMNTYLQNECEIKNRGRDVGLYLLETEFGEKIFQNTYCENTFEELENKWSTQSEWNDYETICEKIWNDVQYFPIPEAINDKSATISYVDSWLYARNYKGQGVHEGTDVMADVNQRGYYPVISMTDGVITSLGWLEMGGYRVGITAPGGAYFYYAHLSSYANIEEGMEVKAGDLLGFMGDSGYGKKEGTVGKFPVHLHVGIYLYEDGEEISYNPYWILRFLEDKKISCKYSK